MNAVCKRAILAAFAMAALAFAAFAPKTAVSAPTDATPRPASAGGGETLQNALRTRKYEPMVQRFAISTGMPVAGWKTVRGPQAAAEKAGADYHRRCAAGDPSIPARIDGVREPVAPGAVVQIAGDCFGPSAGAVTLAGVRPSPIRLTVQSWSNTTIAVLVPSLPGAGHQTAVLAVVRASDSAKYGALRVTGPLRGSAVIAAAQPQAVQPQPGAGGAGDAPLSGKPAAPRDRTVYATGTGAAAALPSNEAAVEFWPELESRTVGSEAIVSRTCAFPTCLNAGDDVANPNVAFGYACPAPCADHEAQGPPSGVNGNGFHWLHEADDVWMVRHPAGWQVQQVNVLGRDGALAIRQPQELNPERTLLTFHWQDQHNIYQDQESGPWFFAKYWFTVTLVGAKGTWHG